MSKQKEQQFSPIAVVGASGLFPGSVGGQSFWRNILGGEDFMSEVPEDHWLIDDYYDSQPGKKGKIYGKRGAFLPKVDFDPMEFGMPPKQLSTTDTAQLLGLVVANKVLEDAASVQFGKVDKADISVILGVASATELVGQMASRIQRPHWIKALREAGIPESKVIEVCDGIENTYPEWDESTFPGLLGNVVAGRIANRLDLGGTNCVVDAACASSLGAVSMAIRELQSGASNLVITGGVDALNDTFMYMCFSQTPALSPTGDCRPFSADADGTMLGEGIGMVALRRLEDAERDGDRIYAVIRGVGSASDGKSGSIYAPESRGQALAIRRAYDMAGYDVDQVELIEAHGTATKAGDAAEFGGLRYAFEDKLDEDNKQWCALGSVKSQIGHTKSAAGSASLFKVVMSLHHKVLPPTIKVSEPNPALNIEESAFYLNTETRPWVHDPKTTRKGSVSSFGFGGSNFHVALEEYNGDTGQRGRYHASPLELLAFSGSDKAALLNSANSAIDALKTLPLPTLAAQLQRDFDASASHRLSIMATDREAAGSLIQQASSKIDKDPEIAFSMPNKIHYGTGKSQPKVAFLFPGQGSQYVSMGSELACEFDQARKAWDIASTVDLNSEQRLDQIVHPIPVFNDEARTQQQTTLTSTQWAQPAIGCVSWSMLNLLDTLDLKPDAVAGHSYGEVTALYAAGALKSPESLLSVSRRRGELMFDAAATPGSMTAVRGGGDQIQAYLDSWDCKVVIANLNSPTQVVIAGETAEIEKAEIQLKSAGLTFKRLTVATAFHTDIVSPSAEPFAEFLSDVKVGKPNVPVYSNTSASTYSNKPAEICKTLAWQLANPVRFQEMIEHMHDDGIELFLEVGPSSLLGGMVNDCLKGREFSVVSMDNRKQDGRSAFWNALGSLSASGVKLNFEALWQDFAELEVLPESIKRSPVTVKMNGANHGKPYPPANGSAGVPKPNPEVAAVTAVAAPSIATPQAAAPQPTTASIAIQPSAAPVRDANWVAAFQSLQEQTLEAQKSFQNTLGQAHQAFLHASEVAFTQLSGVPSEIISGQHAIPATAPIIEPIAEPAIAPTQTQEAVPAPQAVATQVSATEITTSAAPSIDFESMLLDVVAEKTGYPKEMLTLDMELESGLGIDSIKRVEILSTLQEEIPHLGDMDTGVLAELNTLGEIIDLANASAPAASISTGQAPQGQPSLDFESMLLEVVADKTGYPKDMLTLDMELESGLGIDSIKRVEILSTLQEQIPHLGDMDTGVLAELNTLGEIIDLANASAPAGQVISTAPASSINFEEMLLDVVAEKTGYPKDMLTLDMELESGLGIDSIKRVEILSSLQDQIPHLGDMDTGVLAELNTLGEIIELANASAPNAQTPQNNEEGRTEVSTADFEKMLLEVVAEKTGYPVEMLTLDMELESGLGIDSIKRVEILSSLQDQIPHLGDMDTGVLAELNTLGEIIELANASAPGSSSSEKDSFEVDSTEKQNIESTIEMTRYEVSTTERAASGIAIGNIQNASPLYLVGDKTGTAEKLAVMLSGVGIESKISALSPVDANFMVVLTGLNSANNIQDQSAINVEAFEQVRRSAETMSKSGQLLVTVQATGGDFGLGGKSENAAWSTGLAALAKTASREWSNVAVKAIDVETENLSIERIAQEIFAELIAGGPEIEVGLQADGKRITLVADSVEGSGNPTPLIDNAVIVVSGGARGVTAACLQELLERKPVKVAILGRTPLKEEAADLADLSTDAELKKAVLAKYTRSGKKITPIELNREVGSILNSREVRANLSALSKTGSEVIYLPTDIANEASVIESVSTARKQFGPITMIVHAAGVLADKEIHKKTDAQFQSVFKTKIDGLQNILKATESDPLSHMVCFSSVAARTGNSGQVDYAMANDILNRVCQAEQTKRGNSFTAKSIGWGPWAGGMVDPSLAGHFRSQGVELIPMQEGATLFADEVEGRNGKCVEIVYGGGLYNADKESGHHQLSLHVHESWHPQISSHLIKGQPVVPLVLVNEWGLGIVAALYPTMSVVGVRDLNVVKGIQLNDFEGKGDWLSIECTLNNAGDLVAMIVSDKQDVMQYKLSIELSHDVMKEAEMEISEALELDTWEWTPKHIYEELLFHGEKLQVIKKLLGASEAGCRGMLQMPDEADLARFRVAMLDGGLQLALLWERKRSGLASLPTKLGHLKWHMPTKVEGPVLCDLILKKATKLASTWSIVFTDVEKQIIATMEDVKIHVLLGKA